MPRQRRDAPPPRRAQGGRRVPWIPIALVGALVIAGASAWWFEGRFETKPSEAAKQLIPYKAEEVQTLEVVTADGRAEFSRGADGKMVMGGPPPTPTVPPSPGATPAPVTLSPAARVESIVSQLASLRTDKTIPVEASRAEEFGLANPTTTLRVTPKTGEPRALRIGALNPDKTSYYVRREPPNDVVLVSRYSLDDLLKVADEVIKGPSS
jgi:hypothetical protein